MLRIDSHQHFWQYSPEEYPWIQGDWPIRRSFLPEDLQPLLQSLNFDGCVAVQARQTLEETRWLLELAENNPFILGVVGWVDLRSPHINNQLREYAPHPRLVGVRHVVQDEVDDAFMLQPEFLRGIERLSDYDLAYDILIYPKQLPAAIELARRFPAQRFVLDHIAKPHIRDVQFEPWGSYIRELARSPNVFCKVSGMTTEARWRQWRESDFHPYLDVVWDAFGESRLMIGSDWPVSLNAGASYERTMSIVIDYLAQFSVATQAKVLGGNAAQFYKLKP